MVLANKDIDKIFDSMKWLNHSIQSNITKYFIASSICSDDIVILSDLNVIPLKLEWLYSNIVKMGGNEMIIPWPELKHLYLSSKASAIMRCFNHLNKDYGEWLSSMALVKSDDINGSIIGNEDNYSERGFLYNVFDRIDGLVNIKLIPREDVLFITKDSYGMTKQTDWAHWNLLSLDSDIDLIGPDNLDENYNDVKLVFDYLGVHDYKS